MTLDLVSCIYVYIKYIYKSCIYVYIKYIYNICIYVYIKLGKELDYSRSEAEQLRLALDVKSGEEEGLRDAPKVLCNMLQCVAVCCSGLLCVAGCSVCCSEVRLSDCGLCLMKSEEAEGLRGALKVLGNMLLCIALCCRVLQGVAGCCRVLQ